MPVHRVRGRVEDLGLDAVEDLAASSEVGAHPPPLARQPRHAILLHQPDVLATGDASPVLIERHPDLEHATLPLPARGDVDAGLGVGARIEQVLAAAVRIVEPPVDGHLGHFVGLEGRRQDASDALGIGAVAQDEIERLAGEIRRGEFVVVESGGGDAASGNAADSEPPGSREPGAQQVSAAPGHLFGQLDQMLQCPALSLPVSTCWTPV